MDLLNNPNPKIRALAASDAREWALGDSRSNGMLPPEQHGTASSLLDALAAAVEGGGKASVTLAVEGPSQPPPIVVPLSASGDVVSAQNLRQEGSELLEDQEDSTSPVGL
jgi:hypothetical protein